MLPFTIYHLPFTIYHLPFTIHCSLVTVYYSAIIRGMNEVPKQLSQALWRIYHRAQKVIPWSYGGNLPWNEPEFSRRMLREHLDESHAAASRTTPERQQQLVWLWQKLGLQPGHQFLDLTCGPGLYAVELAKRGCQVTGVDFSPASIAHARSLAQQEGITTHCTFVEQDIRTWLTDVTSSGRYDAAAILYGQLAVFSRDEAEAILRQTAQLLRPGARLCLELLNPDRVDKKKSSWWYSDDTGLWGDTPYLHLGERFWDAEARTSVERFHVIHLETGQLDEVVLCDTTYTIEEMTTLLHHTGFDQVDVYPAWDELPLYDSKEWLVYVAQRAE